MEYCIINNGRFKKGHVLSEETKLKMSKTHTGVKLKPLSDETKEKLRKINLGKKASLETKIKMSLARKGKNLSKEHCKKLSESRKGVKLSEEIKRKIGESCHISLLERWKRPEFRIKMVECRSKEKSHFWRGGINASGYSEKFDKHLRRLIRERDKYVCQICFLSKEEVMAVHHIDYNKHNCEESNLITLCHSCHSKTNCNREKWIEYFNKLKINLWKKNQKN